MARKRDALTHVARSLAARFFPKRNEELAGKLFAFL